ncbi:MAG: hypothetical protein E7656_09550 [Ruminococcaceae bacterium]|jgi:hypothetical protein|nr:hypothetical protein [Oscillospiraceae bacterium]
MEKGLIVIDGFYHRKEVKNGVIDYVDAHFHDKYVEVIYSDGTTRRIDNCIDIYNRQHENIPVCPKRNWLFVASWERGIKAYDLMTGELVWKIRGGCFRRIFVYDDYLITVQAGHRFLKLNIENGETIEVISSGTISFIYYLDDRYVFVDRVRGICTVYDTTDMSVYKTYSKKVTNVMVVRDVWLDGTQVLAEGFNGPGESLVRLFDEDLYQK